jgi:hypothetical protein
VPYNRLPCRPAQLKSAFDSRLEKGVKPPELPKRTVKLLPFPPSATDPELPPVDYVKRTVLFVDCVGTAPLTVYSVQVRDKQTMASVKQAVWELAQPGQVSRCHHTC